jgi:hypothetical protein
MQEYLPRTRRDTYAVRRRRIQKDRTYNRKGIHPSTLIQQRVGHSMSRINGSIPVRIDPEVRSSPILNNPAMTCCIFTELKTRSAGGEVLVEVEQRDEKEGRMGPATSSTLLLSTHGSKHNMHQCEHYECHMIWLAVAGTALTPRGCTNVFRLETSLDNLTTKFKCKPGKY